MAACLAWSTVLWGTFQFDDFGNVVRDPATQHFAALLERLSYGLRPLTRLSYFVDSALFGLSAGAFLATNLLLHAVASVLVYALARYRVSPPAALLAGLAFALQPANAEVVAYVSGRSTGLMTVLVLTGLVLHAERRDGWALLAFAAACFAKEVALVFPALVLVWDWTGERRTRPRDIVWLAVAALGILGLLLLLANYRTLLRPWLDVGVMGLSLLANARAVWLMLSLWLRPWALSVDHEFDPTDHIAAAWLGVVGLAAMLVAVTALRRRWPLLVLTVVWPVVALLPTNSIFPKTDFVTEKPLYLAWVGPCIAIAAMADAGQRALTAPLARRAIAAVAVVVLMGAAGACAWRSWVWADPTRLWLDAVAKAPGKSRPWNNLGMAHLVAGRDVEAVGAFETAVRLDAGNTLARTNLATARLLCGDGCAAPH